MIKTLAGVVGALLLSTAQLTQAQTVVVADNAGTEFWLTFMQNHSGGASKSLFLTGDSATSGQVEIPGLGFSQPFSVTPGSVTTVNLPSASEVSSSDQVEDLGIHVTADDEVVVYGLSLLTHTTDAYLGLPVDILGRDYVVAGYGNQYSWSGSEFAIVGTQDQTTVTITLTATTGSRTQGVPYDVVLDEGQVYQLRNTQSSVTIDLTGSTVQSNKPIAVFGGNRCANVPAGYSYCDHIVEQIPPTSTWGQRFVTFPLANRTRGDTFRFLAAVDDTTLTIDGSDVASLDRGEFFETVLLAGSEVSANGPILTVQYSNGTTYDGVTSDPFMMLVPPTEQFLDHYTVSTPASNFPTNFVNVVAPDAAVGQITVDGNPIPSGSFSPIGSSGFSGAQVAVSIGAHQFDGPSPFGVFSYGFAAYDSYGYPGGMALRTLQCIEDGTIILDGSDLEGLASSTIHQQVEPIGDGIDPSVGELVHQLNCAIIVPVEDAVDSIVQP